MKIIKAIIYYVLPPLGIVFLVWLAFSSCHERYGQQDNFQFVCVERSGEWSIFADKDTKVMYVQRNGGFDYNLTVLLNEDGTPRIWNGEIE